MSGAQELVFDDGIDLDKVTKLLSQERENGGPGAAADRMSTLNLVAVYFTPEAYERAKPALDAAGKLHPARLLVLIAQPSKPFAEVRVQVGVERVGGSIAVERIVMTATGAGTRHLQSATLGLLVPELPVVFVWGGLPEGPLFDQALEKGDRVIVDSGSRPLQALVQIAQRMARGAPIGDLAWARIFPWQATAAELFDLPNLREHRARVTSVRVQTAGQPGAEAALLAGWLQARLPRAQVELQAGPEPTLDQRAISETAPEQMAGGKSLVHPPPMASGDIAQLVLEAQPAVFTIRRERGLLVAQVEGDDDGEVVHRVRLPAEMPGRLLGLELKLLAGHDELYAAALKAAAWLVQPRGGAGR